MRRPDDGLTDWAVLAFSRHRDLRACVGAKLALATRLGNGVRGAPPSPPRHAGKYVAGRGQVLFVQMCRRAGSGGFESAVPLLGPSGRAKLMGWGGRGGGAVIFRLFF